MCLCFPSCFSPVKTLPSTASRRAGRGENQINEGLNMEGSCAFPSKSRQSTGSADVGTQKSSLKKGDKKGRTRPKQSSSRRGTRAETLLSEMGCSLPNLVGIRQ